MNQKIAEHLFEFWEEIGTNADFFEKGNGHVSTHPLGDSWPSKVFKLQPEQFEPIYLAQKVQSGALPNSVTVFGDKEKEMLKNHGFSLTSSLKAMSLDTCGKSFEPIDENLFEQVNSKHGAEIFAKIASESFSYPVLPSTIEALTQIPTFKLFLGKHMDSYASCGLIYFDTNGIGGLHMIGTLSNFRGLGLGKKMTALLISEAIRNKSEKIYLVASKAGERIYSKMGFENFGVMETYALPDPNNLN